MATTQTQDDSADMFADLRPEYRDSDEHLSDLNGADGYVFKKALEAAIRENAEKISKRRSIGMQDNGENPATEHLVARRNRQYAKLLHRLREERGR